MRARHVMKNVSAKCARFQYVVGHMMPVRVAMLFCIVSFL